MFQFWFGAYGPGRPASGGPCCAGVAWIVVMALICYIGIEISARIQYGLLAIELIMLVILSVTALAKVYAGSAGPQADPPGRSRGSTRSTSRFAALTSGMLIAIFIYWGWDTAVSVNEETRDKSRAPGHSGRHFDRRVAAGDLRAGHGGGPGLRRHRHQGHRAGQPRQLRGRAFGARATASSGPRASAGSWPSCWSSWCSARLRPAP